MEAFVNAACMIYFETHLFKHFQLQTKDTKFIQNPVRYWTKQETNFINDHKVLLTNHFLLPISPDLENHHLGRQIHSFDVEIQSHL